MSKPLKVAAVVVFLLLVAGAGAGFYVWRGMQTAPDFYHRQPLAGDERLAAIESFDRKVLNLQAALDLAYVRTLNQTSVDVANGPAMEPAGPIAVSFTAGELDTYFTKWLKDAGYEQRFERYIRDPRIGIQDGHLILAGQMPDFGAVVSLWFLPSVDDAGVVELTLTGVYAGRIPVPSAALDRFRQMAYDALDEDRPRLREEADLSAEGKANRELVLLVVQEQLQKLVGGEPVQPVVVFLPLPTRGMVPAEIAQLHVSGEELTLGVELLDGTQRQALLERIRQPE